MHRKEKFQMILTALGKKDQTEYSIEYLIDLLSKALIVTRDTASKYVKEMVAWGLLKCDGVKFINNYYKKVIK